MENATAKTPPGHGPLCRAPLWFLEENDIYHTVKPYRLRFASPNADVPRTNAVFEKIDNVPIHDARHLESLDYDSTGIAFVNVDSELTFKDCGDRRKVEELYLKNLKPALCNFFNTPHVVILDHIVSSKAHCNRRDP